MNGLNSSTLRKYGYWLIVITLIGTFLLPSFCVVPSIPKIEVSDITFPLLFLISVISFKRELVSFIKQHKALVLALSVLIAIAVISIIFNGRIKMYRDWFEPIKFFKLSCFIFFFYLFIDVSKWVSLIKFLFLGLVLFNLFHYFNVFHFNEIIEPYYAAPHHLDFFGLNSIGEPATKRMIGTVGNPNNNAILFLIFLVLFLQKKNSNKSDIIFSIVAIIGVLACQSRTGFVALLLILIVSFIVKRPSWKIIFSLCLVTIAGFLILELFGNSYIGSLANAVTMESAKAGRYEQWTKIIDAMPGHWVLGHGVNKEYFEEREIYAESEYFLVLFRYGGIGLISLLAIWTTLFFGQIKSIRSSAGMFLLGTIIVFTITGLTNSPLHSTKLSIIFALMVGVSFIQFNGKEKI
ncbi:MAG: O-antigen ligase family protein [Crocinitomicaceae bacterium]|nr:O-antigen ligase family protein [Crocinitomicaceae bacterium]